MPVDLIPKAMIIGVLAPTLNQPMPGTSQLGRRQLTQVFSDVSEAYDFRSLNIGPDGADAMILGATPDERIVVQPPVLQVQLDLGASLSVDEPAAKAESIFSTLATRLAAGQPLLQMGVRLVYHAQSPSGDARTFILGQLLNKTPDDLAALRATPEVWTGLKFILQQAEIVYTLTVEPLASDMQMVFVDVDAQFPGAAEVAKIRDRVRTVSDYASSCVRNYLSSSNG